MIKISKSNIFLLIVVVIVSCLYFVINMPHGPLHILRTTLDDNIPRLPVFSVMYLAFLPLFWGTVIYSWIKKYSFRQLAVSIIFVNLIAFCVYLFFQTYVPRESVVSNDIFSASLRFIYSVDKPYNCFPSLHVGLSSVVATWIILNKSKWAWAFIVLALAIAASTLFVKQHYILDVVSGAVLGVVITYLVFKFCICKDNIGSSAK